MSKTNMKLRELINDCPTLMTLARAISRVEDISDCHGISPNEHTNVMVKVLAEEIELYRNTNHRLESTE